MQHSLVALRRQTAIPFLLSARIGYHCSGNTNKKRHDAGRDKGVVFINLKLGDGIGMYKGRDGRQINAIGVRIERNDRHCVVYRGTRAALIEAGLASPAHFPDASKRFTWHFPKSGTNWGIRRRTGGVYSLTKLKDKRGLVDAELQVFSRAALAAARSDSGFRRFMDQVQSAEPLTSHNEPASLTFTPWPESRSRPTGDLSAASQGGLETIAVATLLFGLTIYLWSRQG